MPLSSEQQRVFNALCQFIQSKDQVFILSGSAGTGKTTLLAHLVKYLNDTHRLFQLMAPTGRATHILKQKTGADATTIHKGIYDFEGLEVKINEQDIADSDFKFHYPIRDLKEIPICIVDEGSMVGNHFSEGELWTFGTCQLLNDLTSYAKLDKGGKLIIIGDPVQLPPVNENVSLALTPSFYEACGYKVQCESLTEVFRQDEDSQILQVATRMRSAINTNDIARISQLEDGSEITSLRSDEVVQKYLELFPHPQLGNSVVICYSNATANLYNEQIRRLMYGNKAFDLQDGDLMMVVSNNYAPRTADNDPNELLYSYEMDGCSILLPPHDVMNGEFVQIVEYDNPEVRTVPVYVNKTLEHIQITFVDAVVRLMSGELHHCKMITEPILSTPKGTVSVALLKALFIDFCIRNKELRRKPQSKEFKKAVQNDPYLNALRVRYGYSITGHKSQGGEWDSVFVDFDGVHYNEQGARWMYTAITRAKKHLYTANSIRTTPLHKLDLRDISPAARISEHYPLPISSSSIISSPFHTDIDADYLKQKYSEIVQLLNSSEYKIQNIEHLPYRERYHIQSAAGITYKVDFMYNAKGVFRTPTFAPTCAPLEALLVQPVTAQIEYPPLSYEPQNNTTQYLFDIMSRICAEVNVNILKVVERLEYYQVIYCLKTSTEYAWITFFVNAKGLITYGAPQSQSVNDEKLLLLVNKFRQLTAQTSLSTTPVKSTLPSDTHQPIVDHPSTTYQRLLFFDTECNGLPQNYNLGVEYADNWPRLIQLAWIITDERGNELKRQSLLIIPEGFMILPNVENLTGISMKQALAQGKLLPDVLKEFTEDLNSVDSVIGHNVDFDRHIVGCEMYRSGLDYALLLTKQHICTMKQSTDYYRLRTGNDRYPKLINLHQLLFGKTFDNAHNALADVEATMRCYFELRNRNVL